MKNRQNYIYLFLACLTLSIMAYGIVCHMNEDKSVCEPKLSLIVIPTYDTIYAEHGDVINIRERDVVFDDTEFINHSEIKK